MRILVTGSEGLIGSVLTKRLEADGYDIVRFDLKRDPRENIIDTPVLSAAAANVDGIVYLAAISRVVHGERNPELCRATNVGALTGLLQALTTRQQRPWIIFASSREVYGQSQTFPVAESFPLQPMNIYARTKVEGERLTTAARDAGIVANICRFSTVYGSTVDHDDRLIPAFALAAARGGELRIDGHGTIVDPTHVDDVVDGVKRLIDVCAAGELMPPVHFVSGTSLGIEQLAVMAQDCSQGMIPIRHAEPRLYDVNRFVGDPSRCRELLGWSVTTPLNDGFADLVRDYRQAGQ